LLAKLCMKVSSNSKRRCGWQTEYEPQRSTRGTKSLVSFVPLCGKVLRPSYE